MLPEYNDDDSDASSVSSLSSPDATESVATDDSTMQGLGLPLSQAADYASSSGGSDDFELLY